MIPGDWRADFVGSEKEHGGRVPCYNGNLWPTRPARARLQGGALQWKPRSWLDESKKAVLSG